MKSSWWCFDMVAMSSVMPLSGDRLHGDAGFLFPEDVAAGHSVRSTTNRLVEHNIFTRTNSTDSNPEPHKESFVSWKMSHDSVSTTCLPACIPDHATPPVQSARMFSPVPTLFNTLTFTRLSVLAPAYPFCIPSEAIFLLVSVVLGLHCLCPSRLSS